VAHGFCALATDDFGSRMLVDCGHNNLCGFYPSQYLVNCGCTCVNRLFITNYDEDHLSGLPSLRQLGNRMPVQWLHRNRSLSYDQLLALKRRGGALGPGVSSLLQMVAEYTFDEVPVVGAVAPLPSYSTFSAPYPAFDDTNNLSLVVFMHYPGLSIVFPGDLEKAGWEYLLRDAGFRHQLSMVNVFVASHHGRESGYCAEVFKYCHPAVVVISDESIRYDTQEQCYALHALGITWNGTDRRYVLTTRCDGDLVITPRNGGFYIGASR